MIRITLLKHKQYSYTVLINKRSICRLVISRFGIHVVAVDYKYRQAFVVELCNGRWLQFLIGSVSTCPIRIEFLYRRELPKKMASSDCHKKTSNPVRTYGTFAY